MGYCSAVTLPPEADPDRVAAHLGPLFDCASDALLLVDPSGRVVTINPAARQLFGADLAGRRVDEVVVARGAPPRTDWAPGVRRTVAVRTAAGTRHHMEAVDDHVPAAVVGAAGDEPAGGVADPAAGSGPATDQGEPFRLLRLRELGPSRAEELLLAAVERRYRDVLESVPNLSLLVFDPDLRLRLAAGSLLRRAGYDADSMVGRHLGDVLGDSVYRRIRSDLDRSLAGERVDSHYTSPRNGWQYSMRFRPVRDARGAIVGGLLLSEDVTGPKLLQQQLAQVQRASRVGSVRFAVGRGWVFDAMLRELLGLDPEPHPGRTLEEWLVGRDVDAPEPETDSDVSRVMDLVLPEDRSRVRTAYGKVLAEGGEITIDYRLRHARTGALQYVQGTCEAIVDDDGQLLQAMITHADITGSVRAMQAAEAARVESAAARTQLLRQASDLLVDSGRPMRQLVQSVTDLAAAGLGDGAMVRVLEEHSARVEADFVAHRDPQARERLAAFAAESARTFDRTGPVERWIFGRGRCISSLHPDAAEIVGGDGLNTRYGTIPHFIFAPIRYDGAVLGVLGVIRRDPARPYEAGDDDLTQVLADRIGTVVAQARTRTWAEQQRRERFAILGRLTQLTAEQRELIDQLGDVEQRERILLAEAIHDDPMQTIVAVAMRIDTLAMSLDGKPAEELDTLVTMLESAVNRLRTLIIALNPPDLSAGLGPALLGLAQGIFIGTATQVHSVGLQHVELSTATKGTVYRIFREALVNVRKHAHAAHVEIRLEHDHDHVRATLTDDGVGAESFDSGPGHLGMTTMRARAQAEGGRLSVTGSRGEGTRVTLVLPRKQADDHPDGVRPGAPAYPPLRSAGGGAPPDRPAGDRGADAPAGSPAEAGL